MNKTKKYIELSKTAPTFTAEELSDRLAKNLGKDLIIFPMVESYSEWLERNCDKEIAEGGNTKDMNVPLRKNPTEEWHYVPVERFDRWLAERWADSARIQKFVEEHDFPTRVGMLSEMKAGGVFVTVEWERFSKRNEDPFLPDITGEAIKKVVISTRASAAAKAATKEAKAKVVTNLINL